MGQTRIRAAAVELPDLPIGICGLRILHLSDLHVHRWTHRLERLRRVLRQESFDLLLYTGDFCKRPDQATIAAALCRKLLTDVHSSYGMFGVLGNHDDPQMAREDLPIRLLRNESVKLNIGPSMLRVTGVEQSASGRSCYGDTYVSPDDPTPEIVLAHYPSTVYELPPGRGRLMLAGHTHGGQIRLPGWGCLYTNDGIPRAMARGLHAVRGNWLHVSAGIGVSWLVPARFCCPPEVTVLTLTASAPDESLAGCGYARVPAPEVRTDRPDRPHRVQPASAQSGRWLSGDEAVVGSVATLRATGAKEMTPHRSGAGSPSADNPRQSDGADPSETHYCGTGSR